MDFKRLLKASLIFTIFFSNAYGLTAPHAIVCDQTYALCTSARCVPDPVNLNKSICDCVVEQGKSAGFSSCQKRKPTLDKYKVTHLISTFSFAQFASKKSLTCTKGMPWSNCVDMACTVDPQNGKRAICLCQLNTTQAFFTFGGDCDANVCATGFWSGAVLGAESNALRDALIEGGSKVVVPEACKI